ncbi:MAG: DUF302 domain-containing protein [Caldilineales bacterium]
MTQSLDITIGLTLPYEQALARTIAALKDQGFGVLTEVDVRATLRAKLDVAFTRYMILGVCNPPLAHQALTTDKRVGLMLPCTVVVYENDDSTVTVSALNPQAAIAMVANPALAEMAAAATARLSAALDAVATA